MALIEIPRCPNCGHEVRAADLRREYGRRRVPFDGTQWGIRCPTCRFVSKIHRARAYFATACGCAIAAPLAIWGQGPVAAGLGEPGQIAVVAACYGLALVIHFRWAPPFIQLQAPEPGELLRPSRSTEEEIADDPQYRKDCEAADEQNRWIETMNDPARQPWKCASCGEENPATFEICWKCQKPKA